jgi:membrane-associated protein
MIEILQPALDSFSHFNDTLLVFFRAGGVVPFILLFLVFFPETGMFMVPYLPADVILFLTGAFAAYGGLDIWMVMGVILAAVLVGDSFHFALGRIIGIGLFDRDIPFVKREYLVRTHNFYERYGGISLIISRFFPIFRTFVPFFAGIGAMSYPRFLLFSLVGSVLWIGTFLLGGYVLGTLPAFKDHFAALTLIVIIISVIGVLFLAREIACGHQA